MCRLAEDLFRSAELDEAARVHDGNAMRDLRNYREIVRDKKHGERELLPQLGEQVEHLRLDGHISAVVGSSAISNCGRFTMAMAIITRCRWPPES